MSRGYREQVQRFAPGSGALDYLPLVSRSCPTDLPQRALVYAYWFEVHFPTVSRSYHLRSYSRAPLGHDVPFSTGGGARGRDGLLPALQEGARRPPRQSSLARYF